MTSVYELIILLSKYPKLRDNAQKNLRENQISIKADSLLNSLSVN